MTDRGWYWGGYAGHLCVGKNCAFHLSTYLPEGYLVSTVGHYLPQGKEPMDTVGSGKDDFFETMVFRCDGINADLDAIIPDLSEIYRERYADSRDAERGHYAMCEKWATP